MMNTPTIAFSLLGKDGEKLEFLITEFIGLNYSGDYDLKGTLTISAGNYRAHSENYYCLDIDLFAFCDSLSACYQKMEGNAVFQPKKDTCLSFKVEIEKERVLIRGSFQERYDVQNVLVFEFEGEPSSLFSAMHEIGALKRSLSQLK